MADIASGAATPQRRPAAKQRNVRKVIGASLIGTSLEWCEDRPDETAPGPEESRTGEEPFTRPVHR